LIHPHTELRFINHEIGFGVFATQFIPRGTLTWVCDELDQFVDPARVAALPPFYRKLLDTYTFRDRLGRHVLCWDLARFMNHSCAPCCLGPDSSFEVAVRDIRPGEELTDDYASLHLQAHESFRCHCGVAGCRQWVSADDVPRREPVWERLIEEAMRLPTQVPQPLAPILLDAVKRRRIGAPELAALQPLVDQLHHRPGSLPALAIADSVRLSETMRD
jgi:hypothetical protein